MKKMLTVSFTFCFAAFYFNFVGAQWPRVSIITSVYKGDEFIEGFMKDITQQCIFDQCELIMINANSPGNEEEVIKRYMARYPNIVYRRLDYDPGLYAVWNMAILISRAEYVTNANLDDKLKHDCYEIHAHYLDNNPDVELVYSACCTTSNPNIFFNDLRSFDVLPYSCVDFSKKNMSSNLPNNHPMWRKSLHVKHGLFDEHYKVAGDYEMWLRAVKGGAKFLRVPGILGLYYFNPAGLSTNTKSSLPVREAAEVRARYREFFN